MHFTYREEGTVDLCQGDLLARTPALQEILRSYHPHYFENPRNTHFLVLTQSCDVARRKDGVCGTKYITIAAVRSLAEVVKRQLELEVDPRITAAVPIGSSKARSRLEMFLQRLVNNNEPEFFFLRRDISVGLREDSCAFLRLSIPLRVEHYDALFAARVLQLTEPFQAKLGSLVGQMYSRVGTKDWPDGELKQFVQSEVAAAQGIWLEERQLDSLAAAIDEWRGQNEGVELGHEQLLKLIKKLPGDRKERALQRIREVLASSPQIKSLLQEDIWSANDLDKVLNFLRGDTALSSLIK